MVTSVFELQMKELQELACILRDKHPHVNRLMDVVLRHPATAPKILRTLQCLVNREKLEAIPADPFRTTAPTRNEDTCGQFAIGVTANNTICGFDDNDVNKSFLINGSIGTGKTEIEKILASQMISPGSNTNIAIFAEKRNFRPLLRLSKELVVIPQRFLRLVFYRNPECVNPDDWLSTVISFLAQIDLRFPSLSYMRGVVNNLFLEWGYTGSAHQACPNLPDVFDAYRKIKHPGFSEYGRYKERGESRIGGILQNSGNIFRCNFGIDLTKLWRRNFVIELDGLYPDIKKLIKSLLLASIYFPKLSIKSELHGKQHAIFDDEGHETYRRTSEMNDILPFYDKFISVSREHKTPIIVASQIYSDLSLNIKSNCATKIATGFTDYKDLSEFCHSIGIIDNERKAYLRRILKPGTALVSTPKFPDPFLISVPYLGLDCEISDEEVLERLYDNVDDLYHEREAAQLKAAIRMHQGKPANAVALLPLSESNVQQSRRAAATPKRTYRDVETRTNSYASEGMNCRPRTNLSGKAQLVLQLIANSEAKAMSEQQIRKVLDIKSGSVINKIKKELVFHGYICVYRVQIHKNYISVWALSDKSFDFLNIAPVRQHLIGGRLHRFLAYAVKDSFRANRWSTKFEAQLDNGKLVDILARRNDEVVCIEIGLPPLEKEIQNSVKIFTSSLNPDKVIHVVKDSRDRKKLEELIAGDSQLAPHRDKIKVVLAGEFIQKKE